MFKCRSDDVTEKWLLYWLLYWSLNTLRPATTVGDVDPLWMLMLRLYRTPGYRQYHQSICKM